LQGTVVGVDKSDFRHKVRLLRQRVLRDDANVTLYEYPGELRDIGSPRVIAKAKTDKQGHFDLGGVPDGHYSLEIEVPWGEDWYDVQVTHMPKSTASVTIDVSPNYPDCTGGHEFISRPE